MTARPSSSLRGRPPTGTRAAPPGTGRPGTRSGAAAGSSNIFASGIMVADRPMTQQGLGGMKTAAKGQRQIQDRSYWLGEVRSKCNELSAEIRKVETEIVQRQEENNTFLMFEKRAESLAAELANLQGELHDYNLMIDRINMNKDISEMVENLNALKVQNEHEAQTLERIFEEKGKAEKEIEKLEKQILRQQKLTDNRVQDMSPDMRSKYSDLKRESLKTMTQLTALQNELDQLTSKQTDLEMEMQNDTMKLEAVKLQEKLAELQEREEQLLEEEKTRLTPEQEQQKLLASVKADNQEISTMDRQSKELDERIRIMQDELIQIESELEDQKSEATDKFRQLQKREQTMDEFMSNYEETKQQESQDQAQLEGSIVALLEQVAKTIEFGHNVPTEDKMQALKDDLQFKESEMQKAESTSSNLLGQSSKLQEDLTKVEELEGKIETEKEAMIQDIEKMEKEIETYRNIEKLKSDGEKLKLELRKEKEQLEKSKLGYKGRQETVLRQYNALLKSLEENETHAQLLNLERKWQHLEQNNFAMKEYVASKSMDCESVKENVIKTIAESNKLLQDLYTKSSLLS